MKDRSGRFVPGLSANQFEISDGGVRRAITQFSSDRVPVSLGILLDISGSMSQDPKVPALDDARWADTRRAIELLVTRLDQRDEVFFAVFNEKVALALAWTQDHQRVLRAFDSVRPGGGTSLLDAVKLIAPAFQLARHERKVLLLISDGNDTRLPPSIRIPPYAYSREEQLQANIGERRKMVRELIIGGTKDDVRKSGAILYAIGMGTREDAPVNVPLLEDLTTESGGYVEPLRGPSEISAAVMRICDDLQAQYLLAFEPAYADGKYPAISVKTRNNNLRVRARVGYMATKNE